MAQQHLQEEDYSKPELSKEDLEDMKSWFYFFDKNSDGKLDRGELRKVIHAMCWLVSDEEFDYIFKTFDVDGSGCIEYNEYLDLLNSLRKDPYRERCELIESFRHFDKDRSGTIDEKELRRFFLSKDKAYTDRDRKQLDALLKGADTNGDGKIDIEEFVDLMLEKPTPPSSTAKY